MPLGITQTDTLQTNAVANANGAVGQADGYESLGLFIQNGAGTCTVNVEGSLDSTFTTTQDISLRTVVLIGSTIAAGTQTPNTTPAILSGAVAVAANTTYEYQVQTPAPPYLRARISGASGLGAGTAHTGCTVFLLKAPFS
jgi:hypothetical protein